MDEPLDNFLGIRKYETESEVFRVIPVFRLLEHFKTKQNVLVRPKLWDDPFENYILRATATLPSGETARFGFRDELYGQCWTLQRESDAMWRIYSADKSSVRIRSRINLLFQSLYSEINHFPELSVFVGRVKYESQKSMIKKLADVRDVLETSGRGAAGTLLMKREEFRHEKEVRLVLNNNSKSKRGDIYRYKFDPHELIDEITFDPRMNDDLVDAFTQYLLKLEFSGKINKSPLYKLPNLKASLG